MPILLSTSGIDKQRETWEGVLKASFCRRIWQVASTGDHRHDKHPTKKGVVTVSGHPGKDMPVGTLLSVLKQAQLEKEE